MLFADRRDAGRQLAPLVSHLTGPDTVVVGLPRGGAVVAEEVAERLAAPLDVLIVRKLGVPHQPELAMGAIGEGGVRVMNEGVIRHARITADQWAAVERTEWAELDRRATTWRADHARIPLGGKVVVIVDDGLATGSTARAACRVARAEGAARVVLAVPVAPAGWTAEFAAEADELIAVATPEPFIAVGRWYREFDQTSDQEVLACLDRARPRWRGGRTEPIDDEVQLALGAVRLEGHLTVPPDASGVVVFAHGSGSSRHSPRNQRVAATLQGAGLATLLFDLLTDEEAADRELIFDIGLLARRLAAATSWLAGRAPHLSVGYFGASTGAAAALVAAAAPEARVQAVVSRGGRPDLAGARLGAVRAPTLLIVGGDDTVVLELNRAAAEALRCEHRLEIVPGATHLFEEPGTLDRAAALATDWFVGHLAADSA